MSGTTDVSGAPAGAAELETRLAVRWSEIDAMAHVNNIHFAEYADEARASLVARGLLPEAPPCDRLEVDYLAPLDYGAAQVVVRTRADATALHHTVVADGVERARVRQHHGAGRPLTPSPPGAHRAPVQLRASDTAGSGRLRSASWISLVQEARVHVLRGGRLGAGVGPMVIATCSVDLAGPRLGPDAHLEVVSHVQEVGRSSAVLVSDVCADGLVAARGRSVVVAYDRERGASRPWEDAERARLDRFRTGPTAADR